MKRIGAHYLYVNPTLQLKNGVVQLNNGVVEDFFILQNNESSFTEFYTGILIPAFPAYELPPNVAQVNESCMLYCHPEHGYIFAPGNKSPKAISQLLYELQKLFPKTDVFGFITWGTTNFEKIAGEQTGLYRGKQTSIWLLENIDLIHKKVLPEIQITVIS